MQIAIFHPCRVNECVIVYMQLSYATSAITDRAVYFLFLAFESPTTHFNFILFCFILWKAKDPLRCA